MDLPEYEIIPDTVRRQLTIKSKDTQLYNLFNKFILESEHLFIKKPSTPHLVESFKACLHNFLRGEIEKDNLYKDIYGKWQWEEKPIQTYF